MVVVMVVEDLGWHFAWLDFALDDGVMLKDPKLVSNSENLLPPKKGLKKKEEEQQQQHQQGEEVRLRNKKEEGNKEMVLMVMMMMMMMMMKKGARNGWLKGVDLLGCCWNLVTKN